jgi:hypothetical protein
MFDEVLVYVGYRFGAATDLELVSRLGLVDLSPPTGRRKLRKVRVPFSISTSVARMRCSDPVARRGHRVSTRQVLAKVSKTGKDGRNGRD